MKTETTSSTLSAEPYRTDAELYSTLTVEEYSAASTLTVKCPTCVKATSNAAEFTNTYTVSTIIPVVIEGTTSWTKGVVTVTTYPAESDMTTNVGTTALSTDISGSVFASATTVSAQSSSESPVYTSPFAEPTNHANEGVSSFGLQSVSNLISETSGHSNPPDTTSIITTHGTQEPGDSSVPSLTSISSSSTGIAQANSASSYHDKTTLSFIMACIIPFALFQLLNS